MIVQVVGSLAARLEFLAGIRVKQIWRQLYLLLGPMKTNIQEMYEQVVIGGGGRACANTRGHNENEPTFGQLTFIICASCTTRRSSNVSLS